MDNIKITEYKRNCLLGAVGALLMVVGDVSLSLVKADSADEGLYIREAYLSGTYPSWRIVLLLVTGIIGMALYAFGIKAMYEQILPECKKSRAIVKYSGIVFAVSGTTLHFFVGTLAYWVSYLSKHIGREQAISFVDDYYNCIFPAMIIVYIPIVLLIFTSVIALLRKKTIMDRKMVVFHLLVWQLIFMLIPDIRQALGADASTVDYVLSQASGNMAGFIWLIASYVWIKKNNCAKYSKGENKCQA